MEILRAGSVTAGIAADRQANTDLGFSRAGCDIRGDDDVDEGAGDDDGDDVGDEVTTTAVPHFGNDNRSISTRKTFFVLHSFQFYDRNHFH